MGSIGQGFGKVPATAFMGIRGEIMSGPWAAIPVKKVWDEGQFAAVPLGGLPVLVACKARMLWALDGVQQALGPDATSPAEILDPRWDSSQRKLARMIAFHEESDDPRIVAAAGRLRSALLLGDGTGQTQLPLDGEVDFGRTQQALAGKEPLHADVKLLKLEPLLAEIADRTGKLAEGIGRATREGRKPRSIRTRQAVATCAAAFNAVYEHLGWMIDQTRAPAEREQLVALQQVLQGLLDRNPHEAPEPVALDEPVPPAPAPLPK